MSIPTRVYIRIYALLLALHPSEFRSRYAEEMTLDFEDALHTFGANALYRDALLSLLRQWSAPTPAPAAAPTLLAGHYHELYLSGLSPFAVTRGLIASTAFLSLCLFALQAKPLASSSPSSLSSPPTSGHTGPGSGSGHSTPDSAPPNPYSPGLVLNFTQSNPTPPHPAPRKVFEVASIRENETDARPTMNLNMGPGSYGYKPTDGGYLRVTNLPVILYIQFAYNLYGFKGGHLAKQLPAWARNTRYDIVARTDYPNPTKDDMREMMRALLAERFHLALHPETHDSPVLNLVLAKPGKLGASITPHAPGDPTCEQNKSTTFFSPCGTIAINPGNPDKMAGRKVTMDDLAEMFPGFLGAPVIDKTGLTGTFDFTLDFVNDTRAQAHPEENFPTFLQGLTEQLGFKAVSSHGPVELYTVDHIDPLQEN